MARNEASSGSHAMQVGRVEKGKGGKDSKPPKSSGSGRTTNIASGNARVGCQADTVNGLTVNMW